MSEPPASWDQQEEENPSISSTIKNFSGLNVNAVEFVPSFGCKTSNVLTPTIPKTPPSTPVIVRHTNENENNQIESNDQQPMEEDFPTRGGNQFADDEYDSSFLFF